MRSTYTNALIRKIVEVADTDKMRVTVNDGEENHRCTNFRQIADVLDSVDESFITLSGGKEKNRGWFHIILSNDNDEQLCDYTANDFAESIVKSIEITGDE